MSSARRSRGGTKRSRRRGRLALPAGAVLAAAVVAGVLLARPHRTAHETAPPATTAAVTTRAARPRPLPAHLVEHARSPLAAPVQDAAAAPAGGGRMLLL